MFWSYFQSSNSSQTSSSTSARPIAKMTSKPRHGGILKSIYVNFDNPYEVNMYRDELANLLIVKTTPIADPAVNSAGLFYSTLTF